MRFSSDMICSWTALSRPARRDQRHEVWLSNHGATKCTISGTFLISSYFQIVAPLSPKANMKSLFGGKKGVLGDFA